MKTIQTPTRYLELTGVSEKQINYGSSCRAEWLRSVNDLAREISGGTEKESAMLMPMLQSIVDAAMADESAKAWIERESPMTLIQVAIKERGLA